jgi:hypothetical protein
MAELSDKEKHFQNAISAWFLLKGYSYLKFGDKFSDICELAKDMFEKGQVHEKLAIAPVWRNDYLYCGKDGCNTPLLDDGEEYLKTIYGSHQVYCIKCGTEIDWPDDNYEVTK